MTGTTIFRIRRQAIRRWALLSALVVAGALAANPAAAALRHLRLSSTVPAADARLAQAPAEVRLVFSEVPGPGTGLRLTRGEALVETTEIAVDPKDGKQFFIKPSATLPSGEYTAHWRAVAGDGHASTGEFNFSVGLAE
jgi:methionine-rich copper-binding protein CopC